ncbi:MAG: questin oxidase family protein [Spirochaetota bacterium]
MPSKSDYLKDLIDSYRNYSVEYYKNYTNHLPMAACALQRMGADRNRLMEFCGEYARRLNGRVQSNTEINHENWTDKRGQHRFFDAYIRFFEAEEKRLGTRTMVETYMNDLMQGIGSAAFHTLIKLAYGIMMDDSKEIIESMAYYATSYLPLGEIDSNNPEYNNLFSSLQKLQEKTSWQDHKAEGGNIDEKIHRVVTDPDFNRYLEIPPVNHESFMKDIASATRNIFINSFNFTSLHMVTGTHALRIVLPYIREEYQPIAMNQFWKTAAAAYLSIGAPPVELQKNNTTSSMKWDEIFMRARTSNDAHVIKITFTCYEEEKEYHDPLYRYIAEREVLSFT